MKDKQATQSWPTVGYRPVSLVRDMNVIQLGLRQMFFCERGFRFENATLPHDIFILLSVWNLHI